MPPERLFKYTTIDTATAILANATLRWSSPVAFNDPFDLKNYFHIDFLWSDLREEALQRLSEMLCSSEEPTFTVGNDFETFIRGLRTTLKGQSPSYVKPFLRPFLKAKFEGAFQLCEDLCTQERNSWLEEKEIVRILCLAQRFDNILMWSHYASQHKGVVLGFDSKLLEESVSSHAIKVMYSDLVPTPFTYQQVLDWLLGRGSLDISKYTIAVASSKYTDWRYEEEWRLLKYEDAPNSGRYSCFEYPPDALVSVYFGSRIDPVQRDCLTALVSGKYKRAHLFNMREKMGKYQLEAEPA